MPAAEFHDQPVFAEIEVGSWETTLLSYECRTFLFKALHNVIERWVSLTPHNDLGHQATCTVRLYIILIKLTAQSLPDNEHL